MQKLKVHHKVVKADSVLEARQWIQENDPAYYERYHGHCYLVCDNPNVWEEHVKRANPVDSRLVEESTLGFHLLAEVDSGAITTREDVTNWFKRSLAFIQGKVQQNVVEKVLRDLLVSQMMFETAGRLMITDIGRISAVWYYRPEDVYCWWKNLEQIADNNLWENDYAMTWAICSAPSYNLDYVPKYQAKQVEEYMKELNKLIPNARPQLLPADMYEQMQGKVIPHTRVASFKYDSSRIFQALRQISKACDWERPDGWWHMLETRYRQGATQELAELCEVDGLGVMLVRKLSRFGIKSLKDLIDKSKRHKIERILGKKTEVALASARQLIRTRFTV